MAVWGSGAGKIRVVVVALWRKRNGGDGGSVRVGMHDF